MTALLLAVATSTPIDNSIDLFLGFLGKVLLLVAVVVLIHAAICFQHGKNHEGFQSLVGAFILAVAVPIAKFIIDLGNK